jgi:hypothetical protein
MIKLNLISGTTIPRNLLFGVAAMVAIAAGMTIYVWKTRARAAGTGESLTSRGPVAPPVSGPTEPVTLYVADDDAGILRAQPFQIPLPAGRQQRAEELLRNLVELYSAKSSAHPLGPGSEVRDIYLVDPGLAVIDLNSAFAEGHRSGVLVEELTVASMVETLSANTPGVTRVKFLVDGKPRETLAGHADLTSFYDVSAVHQLAAELQSRP